VARIFAWNRGRRRDTGGKPRVDAAFSGPTQAPGRISDRCRRTDL